MSAGALLAGLWASSKSAAVLILAAALLRALFQSRTPRRVFCLLWDAALARLLILAALPSPLSIWRWLPAASSAPAAARAVTAASAVPAGVAAVSGVAAAAAPTPDRAPVLAAVWLAAALALAAWFVRGHLRFRRACADALPWEGESVRAWLAARPLRRRVQVRASDRIAAPLTYGVLRPVILLPSGMDRADPAALSCVLEHELTHIRRFDALRKAFLAAALCLHWFNPAVWVLYVLCSRDMELACDEAVTARGADRAGYARTLLDWEERRDRRGLSGSHFSQTALEERIRSIMKHKKTSVAALVAVLGAMSITAVAFASAAPAAPSAGVHDTAQAVEGDVMILAQGGENGARQYSVDGGRTWLDEAEYRAQYGGGDWQVEWWTAEEYAAWLAEEKVALQGILGERGYTSSEGWFTWDQQRVDETIALYEGILEDIRNGALYSKTITDENGDAVEEVALGSGTSGGTEFFAAAAEDEAVDEAALLEELRAFGIDGSAGQLTYRGRSVRRLVDGVPVAGGGYAIRYVYTDPDGDADVHTLRAATPNPDGSYDPMGRLTGVAAEGEAGFDRDLIDSALRADTAETAETSGTAEEVSAALEACRPFGLTYEENPDALRMYWNGRPVHSLYDAETGTWFANNLRGTELGDGAVDLEAVYQDGTLRGLRETEPPHAAVAVTEVSGDDAAAGRTFAEIFAPYEIYGLRYTPGASGLGHLTWNGQAVRSFADRKPDGGAFSFEDPDAESDLRVHPVYDDAGRLTGLRAGEPDMP